MSLCIIPVEWRNFIAHKELYMTVIRDFWSFSFSSFIKKVKSCETQSITRKMHLSLSKFSMAFASIKTSSSLTVKFWLSADNYYNTAISRRMYFIWSRFLKEHLIFLIAKVLFVIRCLAFTTWPPTPSPKTVMSL